MGGISVERAEIVAVLQTALVGQVDAEPLDARAQTHGDEVRGRSGDPTGADAVDGALVGAARIPLLVLVDAADVVVAETQSQLADGLGLQAELHAILATETAARDSVHLGILRRVEDGAARVVGGIALSLILEDGILEVGAPGKPVLHSAADAQTETPGSAQAVVRVVVAAAIGGINAGLGHEGVDGLVVAPCILLVGDELGVERVVVARGQEEPRRGLDGDTQAQRIVLNGANDGAQLEVDARAPDGVAILDVVVQRIGVGADALGVAALIVVVHVLHADVEAHVVAVLDVDGEVDVVGMEAAAGHAVHALAPSGRQLGGTAPRGIVTCALHVNQTAVVVSAVETLGGDVGTKVIEQAGQLVELGARAIGLAAVEVVVVDLLVVVEADVEVLDITAVDAEAAHEAALVEGGVGAVVHVGHRLVGAPDGTRRDGHLTLAHEGRGSGVVAHGRDVGTEGREGTAHRHVAGRALKVVVLRDLSILERVLRLQEGSAEEKADRRNIMFSFHGMKSLVHDSTS